MIVGGLDCTLTELYNFYFCLLNRMVKISNQLTRVVHTLKYFTQNDWVWTNHNTATLQAALSESDRKVCAHAPFSHTPVISPTPTLSPYLVV